jgi:hypothetical protein
MVMAKATSWKGQWDAFACFALALVLPEDI